MRILLVTNFPAPYRLPLYDELGTKLGEKFFVIYTDTAVEGHRWQIPHLNHPHHFIKLNESVTLIAKKFQPDIVILGGVNKHTLKLFLFAKRKENRNFSFHRYVGTSFLEIEQIFTNITEISLQAF